MDVTMTKKLMFVLLMSGVVLFSMGTYAMDGEREMPGSSISRPVSSALVTKIELTPEEKNLIIEHDKRTAEREHLALKPPSWVEWQSRTPEGVQKMKERAALIREYGDRIQFNLEENPDTILPRFK